MDASRIEPELFPKLNTARPQATQHNPLHTLAGQDDPFHTLAGQLYWTVSTFAPLCLFYLDRGFGLREGEGQVKRICRVRRRKLGLKVEIWWLGRWGKEAAALSVRSLYKENRRMEEGTRVYTVLGVVSCIVFLYLNFGDVHILPFLRGMDFFRGRPNIEATHNSSFPVETPELVKMVQRSINDSRRQLSYLPCETGNPIDDCWRCDPNWQMNRQRLADCAIGFGRDAIGGKNGKYYEVTNSSDNDAVNPTPGTLRHAVIQDEPLWIIFKRDMVIQLKEELLMKSFKTIDGRGTDVHIAHGACITIQNVTNIIIHGVSIHDCIQTGNAMVKDSPKHFSWRPLAYGDGISIFGGRYIWIDHCSLSRCKHGLIDAIMGSTAITISNNHFTHHNMVMLLGHNDSYVQDVIMRVTIAFNYFGEGLVQAIPRCRHGHFHVVNNQYVHWGMYAIGGSANPTINSVGNRFIASDDANAKEVTKRIDAEDDKWFEWNWTSEGDLMRNGAYFIPSGAGAADNYTLASSLGAKPASLVETITRDAGVLQDRTPSSKPNGNTYMSVSATPMSILSASHSHQIIYFFMCTGCLVLTALNVLR